MFVCNAKMMLLNWCCVNEHINTLLHKQKQKRGWVLKQKKGAVKSQWCLKDSDGGSTQRLYLIVNHQLFISKCLKGEKCLLGVKFETVTQPSDILVMRCYLHRHSPTRGLPWSQGLPWVICSKTNFNIDIYNIIYNTIYIRSNINNRVL